MCVCGKRQRLAQPKTQRRANNAGKGLLAGLGLSWHLGTWVSGGLPPFQELGRERAQIVHSVVSPECWLSFWESGISVCARQPVPMWLASNTIPEHWDSKGRPGWTTSHTLSQCGVGGPKWGLCGYTQTGVSRVPADTARVLRLCWTHWRTSSRVLWDLPAKHQPWEGSQGPQQANSDVTATGSQRCSATGSPRLYLCPLASYGF